MNKVEIVRTSKQRMECFAPLRLQEPVVGNPVHYAIVSILIDPEVTYQTIEGFGGAFTESAAVTWQKLPEDKQNELLEAMFSQKNGNAYNLCRTHMNSCDFSLGNYACCDTPGDVELKSFNIDREKKSIVPMIRAARKITGDALELFISPWSPPAWMKDNHEMNHGGKLLPEYHQAWADYYCRFIRELEKVNIPVWGLTVQNEPEAIQKWDSCNYTAEEERDFVRDYLGPTLWRNGMKDLKLMVWDHNRCRLFERARIIYGDKEAAKYVWGAAYHWYCGECFDSAHYTNEMWPDKKLLFSEGCHECGPHYGEWEVGERYGHHMINDFNNHSVGWVDWNLMLDEQGGPNHVGNYCSAPILVDTENGNYVFQNSHYYIGHFSRYVKRGAKRIQCIDTCDNIESTAFLNPDGTRVAVIMNRSDLEYPCYLKESGKVVKFQMPPHSIATAVIE